jgi:hypothetical protein
MDEKLVPQRTTSQMNVGRDELEQLRDASPTDQPLPRTLMWVANLPLSVRPVALLRHHARIANVIAATWGHPTSLRSYMDCLFSENHGTRHGFPPEVLLELVALKRHHDTLEAGRLVDQATAAH